MTRVQDFLLDNHEEMDLYTKAIARVHGDKHPVAIQVGDLYHQLMTKVEAGKADLDQEFQALAQVTDHYRLPEGVCQTFQAVYEFLAQADSLYYQERLKE